MKPYFCNEYTIPETAVPYTRIDTAPKTDWKAKFIWDASDGSEENVWMCFRKTAEISTLPETLHACISADSRYWLYINGQTVVFEGSVKRGPTAGDSYFDCVEIAPYLKPGRNVISALVWYWGKDTSFSNTDSGKAGFLFEAGTILSDSSWKVCRNAAYLKDHGALQPNYRLPESNIYYDARKEIGDWLSADFDDSGWDNAQENGTGGCAPWGKLYPRGIPMLKDYGLKDYENSDAYKGRMLLRKKSVTMDIPYNAQCTPYLRIDAKKAGKKIRILTENTWMGAVSDTYVTKEGEQEFEALGWFNGEHITYEIPAGVKILELKYRETGYNTAFSGLFKCGNAELNTLWQKSLRTLYVTMRDNFMDCPDRERAQWWGDVTNEMAMSMYALDADGWLLYQKGVASMLGHVDSTNVLQTVVPSTESFFELPAQQLAGICGFWTYYMYTGDLEFLRSVYDASVNYLDLWTIGPNDLVEHRAGSWDWLDWGVNVDVPVLENAWYYYALSCVRNMAQVLGRDDSGFTDAMRRIRNGFESFWTKQGYKSSSILIPDDRANALAVVSGLAESGRYETVASVLASSCYASPYMEYYVLEALCRMDRYDAAKSRMLKRYGEMIREDYSTLWEHWTKAEGTSNHAWSGGSLVILSKYFAGIRPVKAGYAEFVIKPQMTQPDTVECVVPSVKGYIRVTERKTENAFVLDAAVPAGTTARIYIPYSDGRSVKINDRIVYRDGHFTASQGINLAEVENGFAVFSVSAGADTNLHFETCM